jgi:hypothetical protein
VGSLRRAGGDACGAGKREKEDPDPDALVKHLKKIKGQRGGIKRIERQ